MAAWKGPSRGRENGEEMKGAAGKPVNSCTIARKLDASVERTVVGARRDARERFLEPRGLLAAGGAGWVGGCTEGLRLLLPDGGPPPGAATAMAFDDDDDDDEPSRMAQLCSNSDDGGRDLAHAMSRPRGLGSGGVEGKVLTRGNREMVEKGEGWWCSCWEEEGGGGWDGRFKEEEMASVRES